MANTRPPPDPVTNPVPSSNQSTTNDTAGRLKNFKNGGANFSSKSLDPLAGTPPPNNPYK